MLILSATVLPFVLLVKYDNNGVELVKPMQQFATFQECYTKGKELQLYTINHPDETKDLIAAGCAECSKLPEYCGGTEL